MFIAAKCMFHVANGFPSGPPIPINPGIPPLSCYGKPAKPPIPPNNGKFIWNGF